MTWLEAAVLGIVQGITEFLPISSDGHLTILQNLFGLKSGGDNISFDVLLHVATLAALLVYSARDFYRAFRDDFRRWALWAIVGSIPAAVVGLGWRHAIEESTTVPWVAAAGWLVTGAMLWFADRRETPEEGGLTVWKSLLIGCGQALALLPGVSRSGMTVTIAIFSVVARTAAVRFSLLLGAIAIGGAGLLEARKWTGAERPDWSISVVAAGFATAFTAGLLSVHLLAWSVNQRRLRWWAVYCACASAVTLALMAAGIL